MAILTRFVDVADAVNPQDVPAFHQIADAITGVFAPAGATFITQTASGGLTNEQALAALNTGLLKSTTVTGVVSIGVPGVDFANPAMELIAGDGMVGGGFLGPLPSLTFDVRANADGSIIVNDDNIQVGIINDGQHGSRGGGVLHALATVLNAGFMDSAHVATLINSTIVVTSAVNKPTNAVDLGLLSSGILKQTVSGAVATISIATEGVDFGNVETLTDSIATTGVKLQDIVITTLNTGHMAWVKSVRDFFVLDKASTLTADGISIVTAFGGTGRWHRLNIADAFWKTQLTWYIDPAGTNTQPGHDENTGLLTTAPIKSIAEWRRRIRGADYDNVIVVIHALSASTVEDDGVFIGFNVRQTGQVVLVGTTAVLTTGTITGYTPYSGNTRGQVVDSAIPVSWTASNGISTTSGSKYIRKTGTFKQAPLIKDLGSKTVMIGLPVTISETDPSAFPDATITDFTVGDSYEVVTRTHWPLLVADSEAHVRYQCIDCTPGTVLSGVASSAPHVRRNHYVLCGFLGNGSVSLGIGLCQTDACVFTGTAFGSAGVSFSPRVCAFINLIMQWNLLPSNINLTDNVFAGSEVRVWHGGAFASSGTLRIFDTTVACLSVRHRSSANLGSIVGDGNTGKLILVEGGSQVFGAVNVTAVTSDSLPYQVTGVSYSTAFVDAGTGDGIYN